LNAFDRFVSGIQDDYNQGRGNGIRGEVLRNGTFCRKRNVPGNQSDVDRPDDRRNDIGQLHDIENVIRILPSDRHRTDRTSNVIYIYNKQPFLLRGMFEMLFALYFLLQTARTDCTIKINALLGQQLGFAQPYRYSLPMDDKDKDDLLNDMKVVLDLARVSRTEGARSAIVVV